MKEKCGCIYIATSPSGKSYIGKTIYGLSYRRRRNILNAHNKEHHLYNSKFYRAIRKYKNKIRWQILISDVKRCYLSKLEKREIERFNSYKNGYNSDLGGNTRTKKDI